MMMMMMMTIMMKVMLLMVVCVSARCADRPARRARLFVVAPPHLAPSSRRHFRLPFPRQRLRRQLQRRRPAADRQRHADVTGSHVVHGRRAGTVHGVSRARDGEVGARRRTVDTYDLGTHSRGRSVPLSAISWISLRGRRLKPSADVK